jgi:hypothetical protein
MEDSVVAGSIDCLCSMRAGLGMEWSCGLPTIEIGPALDGDAGVVGEMGGERKGQRAGL